MSFPVSQFADIGTAIIPVTIAAVYCHWRGFEKLREAALAVG